MYSENDRNHGVFKQEQFELLKQRFLSIDEIGTDFIKELFTLDDVLGFIRPRLEHMVREQTIEYVTHTRERSIAVGVGGVVLILEQLLLEAVCTLRVSRFVTCIEILLYTVIVHLH